MFNSNGGSWLPIFFIELSQKVVIVLIGVLPPKVLKPSFCDKKDKQAFRLVDSKGTFFFDTSSRELNEFHLLRI